MGFTFELASFTVQDGHEAALLADRPAMINALQQTFPGLLAAWLTKRDDGSWVDVILWRTRAESEAAAEQVDAVPEAKAWFRHIGESQGLQHAEVADQRLFAPMAQGSATNSPTSA